MEEYPGREISSGPSGPFSGAGTMSPMNLPPVAPFRPQRAPWGAVEPDVLIHQLEEMQVRGHPRYADAKAGDLYAAAELVQDTLNAEMVTALAGLGLAEPMLLPVVAEEAHGTNAIPLVLAQQMAAALGWPLETRIIQSNVVGRTRKDGYYRLAFQPLFDGAPDPGRDYVLVDDFIGQGATLANLRGHVLAAGGRVPGITSLTGKVVSAILALQPATLAVLRQTHGNDLENWWRQVFGFGFECLTESEARYLIPRSDADRVREEILARLCQ